MAGPVNLDELVIVIRQATDGYSEYYALFKQRSPTDQLARAQQVISGGIADPDEAPASDADVEDLRISNDKTELISHVTNAINNSLG
jgi:hypothetical protein